MKLERRQFEIEDIEVRAATEDKPTVITGYAARFDKLSVPLFGFREKITRGAFAKSLKEDTIKALWNHNRDMVMGSTKNNTLRLWEDEKGLRFELEPPNNSWGNDATESIRRGDTDGMSFGFETRKDEWDETDEKKGIIRTLLDVRLFEISPTAFPAYPSTSVGTRNEEEVLSEYRASQNKDDDSQENQTDVYRERLKLLELEG